MDNDRRNWTIMVWAAFASALLSLITIYKHYIDKSATWPMWLTASIFMALVALFHLWRLP